MPSYKYNQRIKIYCFTKYSEKGPSSRYRTFQYLPFWNQHYDVKINCLLDDWYFDKNNNLFTKGLCFIKSLHRRLRMLREIGKGDMAWIEYELFPFLGNFAEKKLKRLGIPFVLDYDDATFHWYGNHRLLLVRLLYKDKIDKLILSASAVVTGSPYLTNYAKRLNKNTIEIPTCINLDDYTLEASANNEKRKNYFIIGWLGSRTTSVNLNLIKGAIAEIADETAIELWLMGYDETQVATWNGLPVKFYSWSPEEEKTFLRSIDVGIMPLLKSNFNLGKCGFKLIQYMAMGKPTISTPFEANKKIDRAGINFFAENQCDWVNCFREVNKQLSTKDYRDNREVIEHYYDANINEATYRTLFEKQFNA